jgi:hypothetical protein
VKFVGLPAQELEAVDDAAFMVIKDKVRRCSCLEIEASPLRPHPSSSGNHLGALKGEP